MARPRAQRFETPAARAKLPPRPKPYVVAKLARGVSLTYRRNKKPPHPWGVKATDGHGGVWTGKVADADDPGAVDGLSYAQAIPATLALVRGSTDPSKPLTVLDALKAYRSDLLVRNASVSNATVVLFHLSPTLASKPVGLLTVRDLVTWRDALLAGGMKPVTFVRLAKAFKAALNLCARHDPRIVNGNAWKHGLGGISESFESRNVQTLDDNQARALIAAGYAIDAAFGLYLEVVATSGARISQIVRIVIGDLQENGAGPRLLVPSSRKGRGGRKPGKYPVPITQTLAARLKAAAGERSPGELLLLRSDGREWRPKSNDHMKSYRDAAARAGIVGTTITSLRHSSITRQLLANVPIRIVASGHDTSVAMIEKTYSKYISDHADTIVRAAMLDVDAPEGGNVRPLRRR
jgi:integrase